MDTVVVGAGPAGLAVGAVLRARGVPFTMLERAPLLGASWRGHYERLHLHTPKRTSGLPFHPWPSSAPRFPSRAAVVAYLEDYARAFDLVPETGIDVTRCVRGADGVWTLATNTGERRARHVVIATGSQRVPNVPVVTGVETFTGARLHSAEYANGARFRDARVLIVGYGNSGAEIALDLIEHGARPTVSVRGGVNVVPREVLGVPITVLALASSHLPPRIADATNRLTIRLTVGSLASAGLTKRDVGPMVDIHTRRRVPVIDVGTLAAIRRGAIAVRPGIERIDGSDVVFADGRRESFDAIVFATGYTTGLTSMFAAHPEVLDASGFPRVYARESAVPGLHFCGFDIVPTGALRQIAIEARAIGAALGMGSDTVQLLNGV